MRKITTFVVYILLGCGLVALDNSLSCALSNNPGWGWFLSPLLLFLTLITFFYFLAAVVEIGSFRGIAPLPPLLYVPLYPEPAKGKPKIRWSRARVVREVERLYARGIFPSLVYVAHREPELREAADRFFGSWEGALVAADIICRQPEPDMFYDHEIGAWAHDSLTEPVSRSADYLSF